MIVKKRFDSSIVGAEINGKIVWFFIANPKDIIQAWHNQGQFYEQEELAAIARHFKPGQTFLDIGANVGNHAIYVDKFLEPKLVVAVEPCPPATVILRINLMLNHLTRVSTKFLGVGLSDKQERVDVMIYEENLGMSYLERTDSGEFWAVPGNQLFSEMPIDFIKIDVEGWALNVLHGLQQTIARCRPVMLVEMDDSAMPEFIKWTEDNRYAVTEKFFHAKGNENFLLLPV